MKNCLLSLQKHIMDAVKNAKITEKAPFLTGDAGDKEDVERRNLEARDRLAGL